MTGTPQETVAAGVTPRPADGSGAEAADPSRAAPAPTGATVPDDRGPVLGEMAEPAPDPTAEVVPDLAGLVNRGLTADGPDDQDSPPSPGEQVTPDPAVPGGGPGRLLRAGRRFLARVAAGPGSAAHEAAGPLAPGDQLAPVPVTLVAAAGAGSPEQTPVTVRRPSSRSVALVTVIVALTVVAVYAAAELFWNVRSVLLTIFIGLFLAIGFDPVIRGLQRFVRRRGAAVALFVVLALGLLTGFSIIALVPAVQQLTELAQNIPGFVEDAQNTNTTVGEFLSRPEVSSKVNDFIGTLPARAVGSAGTVFGIIGTVLGGAVTTFAVLALMIYFMLSMPRMLRFAGAAVGGGERASVLREALSKVGGYVTGQLTICACAGIASAVFFVVVGMPYAAVLAIAVAILDAIPQVGATLGAVLSTLIGLTQSLTLALGTLVFFLIYQQLENYLIAPRLFARSVNLSAVAVLISVLIGGSVSGVVGALLALPIAAALKTVLAYSFRDRLSRIAQIQRRGVERPAP